MNTVITSKEAILDISRQLVREKGLGAVNIRTIAAACGVSVGSIYNYFCSKSDLVMATIESLWQDIFHDSKQDSEFLDFTECIQWIFDCLKAGSEKYPGFFTSHSISLLGEEKADGQKRMTQSWEHIQKGLSSVLTHDRKVRPDAFDEIFTPQKFTDTIFSFILSSLLRQNYDAGTILEMVKRTIY